MKNLITIKSKNSIQNRIFLLYNYEIYIYFKLRTLKSINSSDPSLNTLEKDKISINVME